MALLSAALAAITVLGLQYKAPSIGASFAIAAIAGASVLAALLALRGAHASTVSIEVARSRAHLEREVLNTYRQVEALMALHGTIGFTLPAPRFRGSRASPDFVLLAASLALDATRSKPQALLVECGSGASTIALGSFLRRHKLGRLISLECDLEHYQDTLDELSARSLTEVVDLRFAPLVTRSINGQAVSWYDTSRFGPDISIDLLIIDGPRGDLDPLARYPAVPLLAEFLHSGSSILLDDFARASEQEIARRWIAEGYIKRVDVLEAEKGAALARFVGR